MAEGEKKNLTVKSVSSSPAKWGQGDKAKEGWTAETEEIGTVQVVLDAGTPPPKVGDNLLATVYPPKEGSQYPPSAYPAKAGGGGGRRGASPEERRSIERQVAVKIAADKVGDVPEGKESAANWSKQLRWVTDQVHLAIKGE